MLTHQGTAAGTLRLSTVPAGVSADRSAGAPAGTVTSRASVKVGDEPGSYGADLDIDRAGPWELLLADGSRTARIPFVVPSQATSPRNSPCSAGSSRPVCSSWSPCSSRCAPGAAGGCCCPRPASWPRSRPPSPPRCCPPPCPRRPNRAGTWIPPSTTSPTRTRSSAP
ncbi:hypothetical protein NKH77_46735 [Streptomyces sp. M19]